MTSFLKDLLHLRNVFLMLTTFLTYVKDLVFLSKTQTVLPTTCLNIYRLEEHSIKMDVRLPENKLYRLRQLLIQKVHRKKIQLKELQSLIGVLNFACQVVILGRAFLRRLIDLTCKVSKPHHYLRFTSEDRTDIKAWQLFIEHINGKYIFLQDEWLSSEKIHMYTDASGNLGFAAVHGTK